MPINKKPSFNFVLKNEKEVVLSINKVCGKNGITRQVRRSLISDEFALNFIKEFILSADELEALGVKILSSKLSVF